MTEITATSTGVFCREGGAYVGKHVTGTVTFTLQADLGIGFEDVLDGSGDAITVSNSNTYAVGRIECAAYYRWELTSGTGTIDQNIRKEDF